MLRYLLDVETRGSQSLLNIDAFADPTVYKLKVKKPGSDEQVTQHIDLIETFNYLLGLRLENMAAPQTFTASFTRKPDPELPEDRHTKLVVDGKIQQADDGKWWFRMAESALYIPVAVETPVAHTGDRSLGELICVSACFLAAAHLTVRTIFPSPIYWISGIAGIVGIGAWWLKTYKDDFGFLLVMFVCAHYGFADNAQLPRPPILSGRPSG